MPYQNRILAGHDLVHSFDSGETTLTVLRQVSFQLHRGEFVLLMGPSGSGKSTLLAILSGLLRPRGGKVVVLGEDFWAKTAQQQEQVRLRHFGFIFQGFNLFPALTARQQLELPLCWGGGLSAREAARRAEAMLESLGLGGKMHRRPAQLSGGEKQRVAIGRALVKEPALCFADEPTSALDWAHGKQVIELLRAAAHDWGATVLTVSHDPRVAPYADRVLHLEDGSLNVVTGNPAA
jgi:putative ABC transport system ATP-binding protein